MSRIAPWILIGLAGGAAPAQAEITADELIARSAERLAVTDRECESDGRQIVVCAQQNEDDRYRLPFETVTPGDPAAEGVWGERERLQANPGTCQSWQFFRAFCGSVGVSFGIGGGDSGVHLGGLRRVGQ